MSEIKATIGNKGNVEEDVKDLQEPEMEVEVEESAEMEMELEISESDDLEKLEEIVSENVEKENKEKSKSRGKNKGKDKEVKENTETSDSDEKEEPKNEKANLSSMRIMEREIKKGRVTAPQGRIEKKEDGNYRLLLAPQISLKSDKLEYEDVGISNKLEDAKYELTLIAVDKFGETFKHMDGDKEYTHSSVRVELHKPGRDKDVVEIYTVSQAKNKMATKIKKEQRRKEDEEKKAAKNEEENKEKQEESKEQTA